MLVLKVEIKHFSELSTVQTVPFSLALLAGVVGERQNLGVGTPLLCAKH